MDGDEREKALQAQHSLVDALIQAVLQRLAEGGASSVSIRALAKMSGSSVSSIYYHFGDLAHLVLAAHEFALKQAGLWCRDQLAQIAEAGKLPLASLAPLLAQLVDHWSRDCRTLAFAWRECYVNATRDSHMVGVARRWRELWLGFWTEISRQFGAPDSAVILACWFDGESMLHLITWRRVVDRACLDESCIGFVELLQGNFTVEGPWRARAREAAMRAVPPTLVQGGKSEVIAVAAAQIVYRDGLGKLTHRAVAQETGMGLGVVSHHFPSSAELAGAALETIYRDYAPRNEPTSTVQWGSVAEGAANWARGVVDSQSRMSDELLLEVARNPQFEHFSLQLRYGRGRSVANRLRGILGPSRPISPLDGAIFSSFATGVMRWCALVDEAERLAFVEKALIAVLDKMTVPDVG